MKVTITGRHFDVTPNIREYAEKKIQRLEKYFNQIIDVKLLMYSEKHDHVVELVLSGDGLQFFGKEVAGDLFSAIDLLIDKLEMNIARKKDKQTEHKTLALDNLQIIDVNQDEEIELELDFAHDKPMDEIEAFLEMKMDNDEFILFKKGIRDVETTVNYANKNYAIMYKDNSELKMVEIPFDKIKENNFHESSFVEYSVKVVNDSATNPVVEFQKKGPSALKNQNLLEALKDLDSSKNGFLPFFNNESHYFNILIREGKNLRLVLPKM